jgi:hypothetical protein
VTFASAAAGWALPSQASILAQYDFSSSSAASSDTDVHSIASLFADGDGTLNFSTTLGNPAPSAFKSYADISSSLAGNSYWSFTITPMANFELDLAQLVVDLQRDKVTPANQGARVTVDVRSDAGGDDFATSLGTYRLNDNSGHFAAGFTLPTSAAIFQNLTSATEFRLYLTDGGYASTTKGAHIDNVVLSGVFVQSVSHVVEGASVPEPASVFIWSLFLMGSWPVLQTWRRRG